MQILYLTIKLYAPWVHSLKEKRMIVKSLCARLRNKFNIAIAETAEQDTHQTVVVGIAALAAHQAQADSMMEKIIHFIEETVETEVQSVEYEMR